MSVFDWSTTASSNGNSDASINFQEGQAPSTVNDSARALMARVKHFLNMLSGNTTQGGASNAYTLTSGESLSAYADGMLFMWSPNGDSTGAVTLNLDTIGAKKVYMPDGTQAGSGDLDADSSYLIHYDSALDTASGGFKISGFQDTTLTASGYLTVANNLSDVASAATARTNLGLNALAVLSTVNNGEWSGTDLSVANGGTGASVAATALSNLGGQPLEATLTGIAGLAPTANQGIYATGADTFSTFSLTTAGRALLDDASASAQRTTLGVAIGSDVQAYDANLGQIAALAATNSNFIVGNGSAWVAETGATVRTSLGLGTMAVAATADYGALASGQIWSGLNKFNAADETTDRARITNSASSRRLHLYAGKVGSQNGNLEIDAQDGHNVLLQTSGITRATLTPAGNLTITGDIAAVDATFTGLSIVNDLTVSGDITAAIATGSVTTGTMTNAGNANQQVTATGGLTMPNAIFTAGDSGLVRAGASARTITRGASVTMYVNGTNSATATLTARGVMGFNWESSSVVYLTGDIS